MQLVPPSLRTDRSSTIRQSLDGSSAPLSEHQDPGGAEFSRTDTAEGSSIYGSNASISSYASTTSTSGRRMIIPLYNLQAHNVMTNTVVDAGTDAKVAKFQKRGLEVIGLAVLEPVEVWGEAPIVSGSSTSTRTSIDGANGSAFSHNNNKELGVLSPPGSPSIAKDAAIPQQQIKHSMTNSSLLTPDAPPSGAKKMFGKFFRRNPARPTSMTFSQGADASTASSRPKKPTSDSSNIPMSPPPSATFSPPDTPTTSTGSRPLVLGVQPAMSSPVHPPHGRPGKYVWVVRRWLKTSDSSILGGMMGKLNVNGKDTLGLGFATSGGMGQIEVRFEWSRGVTARKRKDSKKEKRPAPTTGQGSNGSTQIGRTNTLATQSSKEHLTAPAQKNKRFSNLSQRTASTHTGTSDEQEQENDGDESDPEDSETPWTCVVSIQRVAAAPRFSSLSSSRPSTATSPSSYQQQHDQGVRVKVATLSPTPHHPKVVSMLKVPFPLPDIEVDKLTVRRRTVTPSGGARPMTSAGHEGLVLTAEEIKDVVSCTGLWLVVREGFGGVGKVSRKGDGWKIRG